MKKLIYTLLILLGLLGCKSWKKSAYTRTHKISLHKIFKNVDNQGFSAQTFDSRFTIKFSDKNQDMSGSGRIKILKDSIIWGSINLLGIPLVKFMITPQKVQYYNKMKQEYYDGDFALIKQQLGVDLSFNNVQNLLLGDLLSQIPTKKYDLKIEKDSYVLSTSHKLPLKSLKIAPFYKMLFEDLQDNNGQQIHIKYVDYQQIDKENIPKIIHINTYNTPNDINLKIQYKSPSVNKTLRFPFKIPSGYTRM